MKFSALPLNARFELDGVVYRKTSPVLASPESGGSSRFLARFAQVVPLDGETRPAAKSMDKLVRADDVVAAFDVCYAALIRAVEDYADGLPALRAALEAGREEFIVTLAGMKKS